MMFVTPGGGYGPRFGTIAGAGLGPGYAAGEPRDALIRFGDAFTATAFSSLYSSALQFGWIGPTVTIHDAAELLTIAGITSSLTYRLILDPTIDAADPGAVRVVVGVEWRTPFATVTFRQAASTVAYAEPSELVGYRSATET
jgi:hypothetical protein